MDALCGYAYDQLEYLRPFMLWAYPNEARANEAHMYFLIQIREKPTFILYLSIFSNLFFNIFSIIFISHLNIIYLLLLYFFI